MAIEFRCIRCGQRLRVADQDEGQRARCPTCNAVVDIPSSEEPAAPIVMTRDRSDVIDYELFGDENQHVEITLDPGEVAAARMENLFYMTSGIAMESVQVGDRAAGAGLFERFGQGSRRNPGGALAMTAFCNVAEQREVVAFASVFPSRLVPLLMEEYNQQVYCNESTILCLARGIGLEECGSLAIADVISMRRLVGDGLAVLQAAGTLSHHRLREEQFVNARTSSIVAFTADVTASHHVNVGVDSPVPITRLHGPGEVWLGSAKR